MTQKSGHRRYDVMVALLAKGESQTEAARLTGFSRKTVQRWLDDPKFASEVRRTRDELVSEASGRVAALLELACDALRDLLSSHDEDVRLSATKATFDVALRLRTNADLEGRLQAIEDRMNGKP